MAQGSKTKDSNRGGLPRSEIESLCILYAISSQGCDLSDLPAKLGISPALTDPVAEAVLQLASVGLVEVLNVRAELTAEGKAWLKQHLSEIGARLS